jgi:hypothetical protein
MVRGGPPVDVSSGKGFQFAQIYYIKLTFNSFYTLLYQPKKWAASRDNFSGTDGTYNLLSDAGTGTTPQYLTNQLTLFQPGKGILSPPITTGSPAQIFSPSGITATYTLLSGRLWSL